MSARRPQLRGALAALLLALALAPAGRAAAQEHIVVATEPGTPVVATEVMVVTGPADEEGKAGLAYLAARSVTAPIRPTLDSLGAHLSVTPYKDAVGFTLIAAPDAWEEAARTLLVALFRDPPRGNAVLEQRAAVRAELAAREANPADAVGRALDAALFGPDHPWSRPTVGTSASVEALSLEDVNTFLRRFFTADRAVAAVVGPVEEARARETLGAYLVPTGPVPFQALPAQPEESPVRRDYNSITTWVAVSYPVPAGADMEALRFLAQLVTDEISFSPTRQSVFNARGEVIPRLAGAELRFQVVTPPEEAAAWAERIRNEVSQVAERPMLEERFDARLRRYRGERLLALAAPEERARELARRLLRTGHGGTLLADLDALSLARLRAAARSLRPPTVVLLGPFLDDDSAAAAPGR